MPKRDTRCPPCKNVTKESKRKTNQKKGIYSFVALIAVSFMWAVIEQRLLYVGVVTGDQMIAAIFAAIASTMSTVIWVYIIWGFIRSAHMSFRLMIILISVFVALLVVVLIVFPW